jgi:hypothetical protein
MADIGCGDIVVKAFRVVLDDYLALALALILPLNELLLQVIIPKRLHKRTELLLLVVPCGPSRVHKNWRADDRGEHLGLFELSLVDVQHDEEVEVDALIVVGGRAELDGAEVDLAVDHLHLALPADAHVDQRHPIGLLVLSILLHREDLGLNRSKGT